ncbi:MAG TPA: L,D-transpeptidase [Pirellulaceae bacterium]|nr:L,D-transpeptidase [Pirellulaceae bacterium]
MNSLKHAIVALLLLGVSYGVYQSITTPDLRSGGADDLQTIGLDIDLGSSAAEASTPKMSPPELRSAPTDSSLSRQLPAHHSSFGNFEPGGSSPSHQNEAPFGNVSRGDPPHGTLGSQPPVSPGTVSGAVNSLHGPTPPVTSDMNFNLAGGDSRFQENHVALTGGSGEAESPLAPFSLALMDAQNMVHQAQFREALRRLSPYVGQGSLTEAERQSLLEWADALALKVVYSPEHVWYPPYTAAPGDTLESLATQWSVPPQLIYYINRSNLGANGDVSAGKTLKKVTGPFRAEIRAQDHELTLYVDDLYAGRFRIVDVGPAKFPSGSFTIDRKDIGGHPAGTYWIGTNHPGVYLHAPGIGQSSGIVFSPEDARDLFGILSVGSTIRID